MKRLKQIDLAKHLQCTRQSISAHLQNNDAPRPDRNGLYDADEVSAYIQGRRNLDNNNTSTELLAARIENLRLENTLLKQKLRIDKPAYPPEIVEKLLTEFLNEVHCQNVSALNNAAYLLAQVATPGECLKILHDALTQAEDNVCRWCQDNKLQAGELSQDWPIPTASFGWWFKGKWRFTKAS